MRRTGTVLVAVALAAGAAGCGIAADEGFEEFAPGQIPFGLADPATTTSTAPTTLPATTVAPTTTDPAARVTLCFVKADLVVEVDRLLPARPTVADVVRLLLDGPAATPTEEGLRSALPAGSIGEVRVFGGVAALAVDPALRQLAAKEQTLAIAQLVCTLTAQPGVGQVSFEIDGVPVEVPRADG